MRGQWHVCYSGRLSIIIAYLSHTIMYYTVDIIHLMDTMFKYIDNVKRIYRTFIR